MIIDSAQHPCVNDFNKDSFVYYAFLFFIDFRVPLFLFYNQNNL